MASRTAATATVRAVKRRLIPTKAALTLTNRAVHQVGKTPIGFRRIG